MECSININSTQFNVLVKACVSLLIFYLYDLSIDESGVLKFPTVIVLLSISPFMVVRFSSVQLLSRVQLFVTPWIAACQTSLSINSWSLLKLMSIVLVMPSNHLILSSPSPPAFKLSQHQGLFQ